MNGRAVRGADLTVNWRTCGEGWCRFETVVLPDGNASGVLIIWSGSVENVVYVGHGGIAKILKWARQFAPIAGRGDLFVTWAAVPEAQQDGVRNYLVARLRPVYRDPPTADPLLAVALPWDKA